MTFSWKKQYTAALFALLGMLCLSATFFIYHHSNPHTAEPTTTASTTPEHVVTKPFPSIVMQGKAAAIWDVTTDAPVYFNNADSPLPLASITKLMTAIVALDTLPETAVVTITPQSLAQDGEYGLYQGQTWKLGTLIDFMLVASSNDAAYAVAEAAGQTIHPGTTQDLAVQAGQDTAVAYFVQRMNTKAAELGLTSMHFNNPSGLDEFDGENGGEASAKDTAKLMAYALTKISTHLDTTRKSSLAVRAEDGTLYHPKNTNLLVNAISGLIASKTGFTDLAGGNLVIAADIGLNHPVVIAVLGSTKDARFTDIKHIWQAVLAYYTATTTATSTALSSVRP